MKAVTISRYGPIDEVVELGARPVPEVPPHEVLIEVRAASVNPIDRLIVAGFRQAGSVLAEPKVLGNDVAGTVVGTGASVTRFVVGDEVFARIDPKGGGTFAEFVAVSERLVALKPRSASFEEAASLPLVALTAWQALVEKAELKPGNRVLIHGGSGGVGSVAIQLARHLGAYVVTTAAAEMAGRLRALGADEVIDYRSQRFEEHTGDIDVVLDTLGGEVQQRSYTVLKPGGVLVSILGAPDGAEQAERYGVRVESFFMRPDGEQLAAIAALVDAHELTPVIDRTFPLEQTKDALLYSQSGQPRGKIVIQVS